MNGEMVSQRVRYFTLIFVMDLVSNNTPSVPYYVPLVTSSTDQISLRWNISTSRVGGTVYPMSI